MKDELYFRVKILEENKVISKRIADFTCLVIDRILEDIPEVPLEKAEMFITHMAMAGKRAEEGAEENPIDRAILEAVKKEAVFTHAVAMRDNLLSQTDVEFPEAEKDFLSVHLCNLLL